MDIQDYDNAKAALERGEDELIPSAVIDAILNGANAIKTWREYHKLSQHELAEKAGISVPYLSQLETSKRKGSLAVLSAIAKALQVSLDHVAPAQL
jgi:predicted transcriptional regulator